MCVANNQMDCYKKLDQWKPPFQCRCCDHWTVPAALAVPLDPQQSIQIGFFVHCHRRCGSFHPITTVQDIAAPAQIIITKVITSASTFSHLFWSPFFSSSFHWCCLFFFLLEIELRLLSMEFFFISSSFSLLRIWRIFASSNDQSNFDPFISFLLQTFYGNCKPYLRTLLLFARYIVYYLFEKLNLPLNIYENRLIRLYGRDFDLASKRSMWRFHTQNALFVWNRLNRWHIHRNESIDRVLGNNLFHCNFHIASSLMKIFPFYLY